MHLLMTNFFYRYLSTDGPKAAVFDEVVFFVNAKGNFNTLEGRSSFSSPPFSRLQETSSE